MAGLERRKEDELLVHINYIRDDIKRLETSLKDTTTELKHVNESQWEGMADIRSELATDIKTVEMDVKELTGKVNRQAGVNSMLAVIASCITTALITLGIKGK